MVKISEAIIHDHKELKENYENIKFATDDDTKTRWRNQFTWELARHSIGEELVVYPAFEKYIKPGGHEMAEKDRQEHQVVIPSWWVTDDKGQRTPIQNPRYESQPFRIRSTPRETHEKSQRTHR
jgi:hypothetical protein